MTSDLRSSLSAWRSSPSLFATEALGARLWAKQIEILEALQVHKRVAVASCHESGKTFLASVAATHCLTTLRNSIVVSTAPGNRQVQSLLGAEICARFGDLRRTVGGAADADIGFPVPTMSSWFRDRERFPKWYWIGFSTSPDQAQEHSTKFVGFHPAKDGRLLLIFDEACGIGAPIWHAAEGLMSGDENVRHLALGNPTDSAGEFARCWRDPDWHKISISAFDCPNLQPGAVGGGWGVTRQYVERMERKYGRESAAYQAKVLGQFPSQSTDTLIGTGAMQAAVARVPARQECAHEPQFVTIGNDVARFGNDQTVFYVVCESCQTIIEVREYGGQDLMRTVGETIALATRYGIQKDAGRQIAVDTTGLGAGVVDRLREQDWRVRAEDFGAAPRYEREGDERFVNRRSELWWHLREWIEDSASLASASVEVQDQLFADLTSPRYKYGSDGRIALEKKGEIKKRLGRSPDHGDALALAIAAQRRRPHDDLERDPRRNWSRDDIEDEEDDAKADPMSRQIAAKMGPLGDRVGGFRVGGGRRDGKWEPVE